MGACGGPFALEEIGWPVTVSTAEIEMSNSSSGIGARHPEPVAAVAHRGSIPRRRRGPVRRRRRPAVAQPPSRPQICWNGRKSPITTPVWRESESPPVGVPIRKGTHPFRGPLFEEDPPPPVKDVVTDRLAPGRRFTLCRLRRP